MSKKFAFFCAGGFLLLFCVFSEAAYAAADTGVLEEIYNNFNNNFGDWIKTMGVGVIWVFDTLMFISFLLAMYQMAISENLALGSILGLLFRTIMFASLVHWALDGSRIVENVKMIPNGFLKLSSAVTGVEVKIFELGRLINDIFVSGIANTEGMGYVDTLVSIILIFVIGAMLFAIIGVMLMIQIEMLMVALCGLGLVMLSGLTYFRDYFISYIKALINCGLRLFICGPD